MLCIFLYSVCILYKPGPEPYIADWLSHYNHAENKESRNIRFEHKHTYNQATVHIPICTFIGHIKAATGERAELQMLKMYIIKGWPHTKDGVETWLENTGL